MKKRWWRRRPLMCPEVGRTLQAYLDGRVDDDWADRVRAHLRHCRRCGMEAKTYAQLKEALRRREIVIQGEARDRLRDFATRLASGQGPPGS